MSEKISVENTIQCQRCGQSYRALPRYILFFSECASCGASIESPSCNIFSSLVYAVLIVAACLALWNWVGRLGPLIPVLLLTALRMATNIVVVRAIAVAPDEAAETAARRRFVWSGILLALTLGGGAALILAYLQR
jgi:hypothetical protein